MHGTHQEWATIQDLRVSVIVDEAKTAVHEWWTRTHTTIKAMREQRPRTMNQRGTSIWYRWC